MLEKCYTRPCRCRLMQLLRKVELNFFAECCAQPKKLHCRPCYTRQSSQQLAVALQVAEKIAYCLRKNLQSVWLAIAFVLLIAFLVFIASRPRNRIRPSPHSTWNSALSSGWCAVRCALARWQWVEDRGCMMLLKELSAEAAADHTTNMVNRQLVRARN